VCKPVALPKQTLFDDEAEEDDDDKIDDRGDPLIQKCSA
jgi:hypothetical protein